MGRDGKEKIERGRNVQGRTERIRRNDERKSEVRARERDEMDDAGLRRRDQRRERDVKRARRGTEEHDDSEHDRDQNDQVDEGLAKPARVHGTSAAPQSVGTRQQAAKPPRQRRPQCSSARD